MAEHPVSEEATTLLLSERGGGTSDTVASSNQESVRISPRTLDIIKHLPPTINSLLETGTELGNVPPNDEKLALRISNIPASVTPEQLARWLNDLNLYEDGASSSRGPKRQRIDNIRTLSLAPSPSSDYDRYQVATVNFRKLPSELEMCRPPSTSLVPIQLGEEESRFSALFDSHFEGLTPLNNPNNPALDIIAVTGLAGHAFGSWRSPDGPEMWLRDFVPKDLEHSARILTYGYNNTLATESSKVRIGDLATSFLEALKKARSQKGTTQRPIVFIGHSLGGVVIKKALRKADCSSMDLKDIHADILRSCHGIMFFGVPNLTLEVTNLREMVKGGPNNHLIEDLGGTSQFLETLGEEFCHYFKRRPIKITCFHELKDTSTVQLNRTKNKWERSGAPLRMVTAESAIHPPTLTGIGLDADHSSMVKYKSVLEKNYQLVRSELCEFSAGITLGPSLVLLDNSQRETILQWLSKIEYKKHHATAKETILDKTGQWLLNKNEFRDWRSTRASSILWLHGIPGAGKTKLVSAVIDFLNSETTRHEPIVYFYCSRSDPSRRNSAIIMQSVVKQLSLVYPHLPEYVVEEYNRRREDDFAAGFLDFEESQDLLISLLSAFPQTTIVIDALDENDVEERLRLLGALQDILRRTSSIVRIFVASRDDQDIKLHLEHVPNLFIKAEDNRHDIERFIHREVEHAINTRRLLRGQITNELKKRIISVIADGAKGMFQWANLQIKQLYSLNLEEDIWDSLGRLPKTLEETYSQILDQISSKTPREQEYVKQALMWVMCAEAPLHWDLWAALTFFPKPIPPGGTNLLLGLCSNLVTFDQQLRRVVFAHLSVEEYLEKTDTFSSQNANRMALAVCLSACNSERDGFFIQASLDFHAECVPATIQLTRYCIVHWPYHAEHCYEYGMGDHEVDLLQRFLGTPKEPGEFYLKWINLSRRIPQGLSWVTDLWYKHRRYLLSTPPSPIFLLPCFSFGKVLQTCWKSAIPNIDTQNDMGHTPLLVATFQGNESAMNFLLDNGANVNAKRGFPAINTLMAAIISHKPKALLKLIDAGASIGANSCNYRTVLEAAARDGDKGTVKLILSITRNIEINEDVLKAAAGNPNQGGEIMAILLDQRPRITEEVMEIAANNPNGSDIFMILCANYPYLTITEAVLVAAARNFAGTLILKALLSKFPDTKISQAIFMAAAGTCGGNEITQTLLNKHPNIEITDSTVRAASKHSFPRSWEVMQMLLSRITKILYDPEDIFCGIVENCYSSDTLHMLLTISPKFNLSWDIIRAIDRSNYCNEIREILKFHGLMKARIELLSAAAERSKIDHTRDSSWPPFLHWPPSLLVPLFSVSSLPAASVARLADEYLSVLEDTHHGREMMNSLLSTSHDLGRCQLILEAATESKRGAKIISLLLERYPEIEITEAILHAAIEKVYPKDVMELLLSRCPDQLITEKALIMAARSNFREASLKTLIFRCPEEQVTEFVVGAIADYTLNWISIILSRCTELVATEDVMLKAAQGGTYTEVVRILLKQHPNSFKALERSLTSRPPRKSILHLLLNQYPRTMITSPVLIATIKNPRNYPTDINLLLDRCTAAIITVPVLTAAAGISETLFTRLLDLFPNAAVAELVLVQLAGSKNRSRKMERLLARFPDIIITEVSLITLLITEIDSHSLCRSLVFVLNRSPNISITHSVLNMLVDILVRGTFEGSEVVMTLLLDRNLHFMIAESALIAMMSRSIGTETIKLLLSRCPDMVVTEAVLVAAAGNPHCDALRLLVERHPDIVVTERILLAAAGNPGSELLRFLLNRYPEVVATEAVLVAVVDDQDSELLRFLLGRHPDVVVTEAVLVAAARKHWTSGVLQFLLDRRLDMVVTETVLVAVVDNQDSKPLQFLLERYPDVVVTEAVLVAVVERYWGFEMLRFLLDRRPDVVVTEAVLVAVVERYWGFEMLRFLLDRRPDVVVTEAVLVAAVDDWGSGLLRLLLDRHPDIVISEAVLVAAAGRVNSEMLRLLLDRRPDFVVTEAVLVAASQILWSSEMLRFLLDREPELVVTEAVLVAVVKRLWGFEMLRLLLERRPDMVVTEAVLLAAAGLGNFGMLRLLLDRRPDFVVTEAVLVAASQILWSSEMLWFLLDREPELVVTEAVLVAVVKRLWGFEMLRFFLDRYPDIVISEAVLVAAGAVDKWASVMPRLLLDRRPDMVVTEAVLVAVVPTWGSEFLQFLLDRHPEVVVTEVVLAAAVGSGDSGVLRVLLDRNPDVVTEAVLVAAAGSGHCDVLRLLVERHPDIVVTEGVLLAAAGNPDSKLLRFLLDRYPNILITKLVLPKLVQTRSRMDTETLERIMDRYPEPTIGEDFWTTPSHLVTQMKLLLARRDLIIETPSAGTCINPE